MTHVVNIVVNISGNQSPRVPVTRSPVHDASIKQKRPRSACERLGRHVLMIEWRCPGV
jgi:hypothetical protein